MSILTLGRIGALAQEFALTSTNQLTFWGLLGSSQKKICSS
jgi:hypothetical protein